MFIAPDFTADDYGALFDVVDDLIRHRDSESTEASDFIATLQGARGDSAQHAALTILRRGFSVTRRGIDMGHKGFVGACIAQGTPALATLVVKAGAPKTLMGQPWTPPATGVLCGVEDNGQAWLRQALWADFLSSYDSRADCLTTNGEIRGTRSAAAEVGGHGVFATILMSLGQVKGPELTAEMVDLLRAVYAAEHPGLELPGVHSGHVQRLPGNFHYALLHVALFGTMHVADVLTRAETVNPAPRDFGETVLAQHDVAMALLGFLQEVKGNRPHALGHPSMDAAMFALAADLPTARNPRETLRELVSWYVSAGWVDLDARLGSHHQDIADCMPLDVALLFGGPPAAVFLELGCDTANPQLMFNKTGEGIIAAAQRSNRPETAALVTEVMLRRQLRDAAPAADAGDGAAPARRRRLNV